MDTLSQQISVVLMSPTEARECVDSINAHMGTARARLLELYQREGWRALGYESWRVCAVAEFQQSQTHLYRQLQAAEIEREISPIGEIGTIPESHIRPLVDLETADERRDAYAQAVETAPNGHVTAAHVQTVVNTYKAPTFTPPADEAPEADDWWDDEPEERAAPIVNPRSEAPLYPVSDERRLQAEAEAVESDRLMTTGLAAIEGAQERTELKDLRVTFFRGMSQTTRQLLSIDPEVLADALSNRDADSAERFFNDCRRWFTALEQALRQPLRAVK